MITKGSEEHELTCVHIHANILPKAHVHRMAGAGSRAEKRVFGSSKNSGEHGAGNRAGL